MPKPFSRNNRRAEMTGARADRTREKEKERVSVLPPPTTSYFTRRIDRVSIIGPNVSRTFIDHANTRLSRTMIILRSAGWGESYNRNR